MVIEFYHNLVIIASIYHVKILTKLAEFNW